MSDQEKKILENLGKAIHTMTELEKERFLGFSEGVVFKAELCEKAKADPT